MKQTSAKGNQEELSADGDSSSSLHYIDKKEAEIILQFIEDYLVESDDMSETEKEEIRYKANRFKAFKMKIATFRTTRCKNPSKIYTRRLRWSDLPELLNISGLTYKDIIEAVCEKSGAEVKTIAWSTDAQARMCAVCDRFLTKRDRAIMIDFVKSVTSNAFRESVEADDAPAVKLFTYTSWKEARRGDTKEQIRAIGMEKKYLQRFGTGKQSLITFSQTHMLADMFGVSIHWMLGLGEDDCVLAQNGSTEIIMDYFCLLPEEMQEAIVAGLEMHVGFGGVNND